ncbi:Protein of unknown function [Bacteroidales bacterium WCE2004]|nr:Protein of unknown function [Bacteroidales bacterium WCE2004]
MNCKPYFILSALLLLAAGCSRELTYKTFELEDSVELAGIDAGCEVSCAFDYVTGGVGEEVKDKINASIVAGHILFDVADGRTDVPAACRQWVAEQLGEFSVDDSYDEENAMLFHFEFKREGRFTTACKSRNMQTYTATCSDYTGGAHGMYGIINNVFDLTTGEVVTEPDLFADGYKEGVTALLKKALDAWLAENGAEEDMVFGQPEPYDNFAVSEEGVTWTYNPYEIAPFAVGAISLTVSWADLKPYLK